MTRTHFAAVVAGLMLLRLMSFAPDAAAQAAAAPDSPSEARPVGQERFKNFVVDAAGPVWLAEAVGYAAISQARNTPAEWGGGAKGFGKRYASLLGQGAI